MRPIRVFRPASLVVVALVLAPVLAACGSGSAGGSTAGTTTAASTSATTAPPATTVTTAPVPTTISSNVYFVRNEVVNPVAREVTPPAVARGAMTALLQGPSAAERAAGLTSSIPAGTTLRGLRVARGIAYVDLSSGFESGGGSVSMLTRVAQVVHTLTWFPSVHAVRFLIDGVAVSAIGGEGVIVDHPLTRADVEGQAPAILVESPLEGASASSPLVVRGTANVFEAVLHLRLVDDTGAVLAQRRVMATSGTGTRGTFSASLVFRISSARDATLTAFERSAADGSPVNTVSVGLHLHP